MVKILQSFKLLYVAEDQAHNTSKSISSLTILLFNIFLFASLLVYFFEVRLIDELHPFLHLQTCFISFSGLVVSVYLFYKDFINLKNTKTLAILKDVFFISLITIAYCIQRYQVFDIVGLWGDEYSQYIRPYSNSSYVHGALFDVQPPIGYLNTFGITSILGPSLFSIKFLSLFTGLLSSWLFYCFSKLWKCPSFISFILTTAFLSYSPVFDQTLEARNIAQMIFCLLFYLITLMRFFDKPEWKYITIPFYASLIFVFSAGFQTFIICGILALVFWILRTKKRSFKTFYMVLPIMQIPYIFLIPYFQEQFIFTNHYGTLDKGNSQSLLQIFNNFSIGQLGYFFEMTPMTSWICLFLGISAIFCLFGSRRIRQIFLCYVFMTTFFILSFHFIFTYKINWFISSRYLLVLNVLICTWLAVFYGTAQREIRIYGAKIAKLFRISLFIIIVLILIENYQSRRFHFDQRLGAKSSDRLLYKEALKIYPDEKYNFYVLNLSAYRFAKHWFIAPEIFLDESNAKKFVTYEPFNLPRAVIRDLFKKSDEIEPIFCIDFYEGDRSLIDYLLSKDAIPGIIVQKLTAYVLLSLDPKISQGLKFSEKVEKFYSLLIEATSNVVWNVGLKKDLAEIYWSLKKYEFADKLVEELNVNEIILREKANAKSFENEMNHFNMKLKIRTYVLKKGVNEKN